MFLFLLFLHFYSCSSFFPFPLFHLLYFLFYLFSPFLWDTTQNDPHSHPYILLFLMRITLTRVPGLHAPPPLLHKMPNISETIQIPTPKPYIILFPMISCIQWHWPDVPLGYAPPPPVHIRHNISETVQNPSLKPYTLCLATNSGESIMLYPPKFWVSVHPPVLLSLVSTP